MEGMADTFRKEDIEAAYRLLNSPADPAVIHQCDQLLTKFQVRPTLLPRRIDQRLCMDDLSRHAF